MVYPKKFESKNSWETLIIKDHPLCFNAFQCNAEMAEEYWKE